MTRIGVVLGFVLTLTTGAMAQDEPLPARVAQAYQAYETAMAAGDRDAATGAAATAWRAARDARIDPELIGILAENYGQLALAGGEYGDAYSAWRNAAEISDRLRAPAAERAMRWYQASLSAYARGEVRDAQQCSTRSSQVVGEGEGVVDDRLSGDIHMMVATTSAGLGRLRPVRRHASQAIAAYQASGRPHDFVFANAYYLSGIGHFFTEDNAASALDFNMARGIYAELEAPERSVESEIARSWGLLTRSGLSEVEVAEIDAQIALSKFPNGQEEDESAAPFADEDHQDAEPTVRREPRYPQRAAESGREGIVAVRFTVTEEGRTEDIEVIASIPTGVFDEAAVRAVGEWRYSPAIWDGVPVRRPGVETHFMFTLRR